MSENGAGRACVRRPSSGGPFSATSLAGGGRDGLIRASIPLLKVRVLRMSGLDSLRKVVTSI